MVKKSNLPFLRKFGLSYLLFCRFSLNFFTSITFGDGFFQFQDNKVSLKQALGHNHVNMIFQPGQYPFKNAKIQHLLNFVISQKKKTLVLNNFNL